MIKRLLLPAKVKNRNNVLQSSDNGEQLTQTAKATGTAHVLGTVAYSIRKKQRDLVTSQCKKTSKTVEQTPTVSVPQVPKSSGILDKVKTQLKANIQYDNDWSTVTKGPSPVVRSNTIDDVFDTKSFKILEDMPALREPACSATVKVNVAGPLVPDKQAMSDGTKVSRKESKPDEVDDNPPLFYLVRPPPHLPQYAVTENNDVVWLTESEMYGHYIVVNSGELIQDVVAHGYGWLKSILGKGVPVYAASAVATKNLPFYKWGPVAYEASEYVVLMPGLTSLVELTSGSIKDHLQMAVTAKLNKKYGINCPDKLMIDTSRYFTNRIHYLQCISQHQFGETRRVTNNNETLGLCDPVVQRAVSQVGVLSSDGNAFVKKAVECNINDPYPLRWDVKIGTKHGVIDYSDHNANLAINKRIDYDVVDKVPVFNKHEKFVNGEYRTCFMQFVGSNVDPFLEYANTANNFNLAQKRMLAVRPGEIHYRKNSRMLMAKVINQIGWYGNQKLSTRMQRMKDKCYYKSEVKDNDFAFYHTNRHSVALEDPYPSLTASLRSDVYEAVSIPISKLIMNCTRTRVAAFVDTLKNSAHWAYYSGFHTYLTCFEPFLSREYNASIPHVKKALRQAYVNGVKLHDDQDSMTRRLNAAVKRELAKYGKVPRLFVSYDAGCMYANELPEYVKCALDGEWGSEFLGVSVLTYIVGKPRTGLLTDLFRKMAESLGVDNYIFIVIYSDDSTMSGCVGGTPFGFCVDVSSNDSAQDATGFIGLYGCLSNFHPKRAEKLIEQCMKPIYCRNPENVDDYYTLEFDKPFEGSGTCLTKTLNDIAAFCNLQCAAYLIARHPNQPEMFETYVKQGAFLAGHVVTVDVAGEVGSVVIEKMQFLKHSPLYGLDGLLYSVPNTGPKTRSLGTMRQSVQAVHCGVDDTTFSHMNTWDRCDRLLSGVVEGWKNDPCDPVTVAFRSRFNRSVTPTQVEAIKVSNQSGLVADIDSIGVPLDLSTVMIDPLSYCTRYDLQYNELVELLDLIRDSVPGQTIPCTALGHIYATDYGFPLL